MKRIVFILLLSSLFLIFSFSVREPQNFQALAYVNCPYGKTCQEIEGRDPVNHPNNCGTDECSIQMRGCPAPEYPGPCFQCGTCVINPNTGPSFKPTPCKEGTPQEGIETALGCIPTANTTGFIAWVLKFAIGIGGGIAFILMLIGVFQIITSSGDPERLKAGKELITSALIGLLMIIFSLFLLQLIGVQILQIPGFGK